MLLILLALLVFPAAASAIPEYKATEYPADFTGSSLKGDPVFKTEAGNIECDTHLEGTMEEPDSTLNLIPSYTECSAFGIQTATVTATECDFILHATEKLVGAFYRNTLDIACFKPMKVVASTCEVEFKTQTGLQSVTASGDGEGGIIFDLLVSGMTYTVTKDGFLCPFNGTGTKSNGQYTGTAWIGGSVILTISGS